MPFFNNLFGYQSAMQSNSLYSLYQENRGYLIVPILHLSKILSVVLGYMVPTARNYPLSLLLWDAEDELLFIRLKGSVIYLIHAGSD